MKIKVNMFRNFNIKNKKKNKNVKNLKLMVRKIMKMRKLCSKGLYNRIKRKYDKY